MKKLVTGALIFIMLIVSAVLYQLHQNMNIRQTQKAALILNGSSSDHSWNEAHTRGMKLACERLGVELTIRDNVPESSRSNAVMEELIKDGTSYIFCASFGYAPHVLEMADKHPETKFFHCSGLNTRRNLTTYFARIYQMRYLAGIVAGLETRNNRIGYVASFPISEVNRGINAFTRGVRAVNPRAQVFVRWSNSWLEDTMNGRATEQLLQTRQPDVLTLHTNSLEPLRLADSLGVRTIGYNFEHTSLLPGSALTAAVWHWDKTYERFLSAAMQGSLAAGDFWDDCTTGAVGLSPLSDLVKPETRAAVEREQSRLMQGSWDVFNGPVRDTNGALRVPEGENMPDSVLLQEFNWYVEGAVIDE